MYNGSSGDPQKANALKQSLDWLDMYLEDTDYAAGDSLTIADFALLASVTHLEGVDYSYKVIFILILSLNNERINLLFFFLSILFDQIQQSPPKNINSILGDDTFIRLKPKLMIYKKRTDVYTKPSSSRFLSKIKKEKPRLMNN